MTGHQEGSSTAPPPYIDLSNHPLSNEDKRLLERYAPLPKGFEEDEHGVFHWVIDDYDEKLKQSKESSTVYSQAFTLAGCQWQLHMYPQSTLHPEYVGMRVRCDTVDVVPKDWEKCVVYGVVMSNVNDPNSYENATSRFRVSHKIPASVYDKFTIREKLSKRQTYNDKPVLENNK
ncbi:hypothetical protein EC988_002859, partial [Linderina pennispora]